MKALVRIYLLLFSLLLIHQIADKINAHPAHAAHQSLVASTRPVHSGYKNSHVTRERNYIFLAENEDLAKSKQADFRPALNDSGIDQNKFFKPLDDCNEELACFKRVINKLPIYLLNHRLQIPFS